MERALRKQLCRYNLDGRGFAYALTQTVPKGWLGRPYSGAGYHLSTLGAGLGVNLTSFL